MGQVLASGKPGTDAVFIADYSNRYESCCVNVPVVVGPTAPLVDLLATDAGTKRPADPFSRDTFANRSTDQKIKDRGLSLQVDYELTDDLTPAAARYNIGSVYEQQGKTAQAKLEYTRALEIDPTFFEANQRLADLGN